MPRLITGLARFQRAIAVAALAVVATSLELVDDLRRDVVLDRHAVGRDVARRRAVEVRAAHVERIAAERARDLVDDVLDREHALRPAEAAERGVRHRVGLAAVAVQRDVGQPVRVVGVEHRAVVDRAGQVGREAAARRELEVERRGCGRRRRSRRRTSYGKAWRLPVERMSSSRSRRSFTARPGPARDDRGDAGEERHLRFLAAEAAAHAAAFDDDVVRGDPERVRDHVLHLARMLRRRVDVHAAVLARHRERDLAFEVEVVLPAAAHRAAQPVRRARERRRGVAARHVHRRQHDTTRAAIASSIVRIAGSGSMSIARELRGAARGLRRRSAATAKTGWPANSTTPAAKIGSSCCDRTDVVDARDVGGGDHRRPRPAPRARRRGRGRRSRPCATGLTPSATCSVSRGSGRSSV